MKTKLEMAHEWAIELLRNGDHSDDVISCAWRYADAMQVEADKRLAEAEYKEEWQPDWSQAHEWANWWAIDADGDCYWFKNKPEIMSVTWLPFDGSDVKPAPSFDYTGDWRDSLRKRPN